MSIPRILHYPGSKWSMADWIISHMPEHSTYLEPFFGSGAVFFNKKPSALETINDLDGEVVNLFKVMRDNPDELARMVQWTPYSRDEYYSSYQPGGDLDELERARRFLVRCWMAHGAKTSDRTGWRSIMNAKDPHPAQQWLRVPERIRKAADRLLGVQVESQDALQVIERYRRRDVLIYADPPYVMETRSGRIYKHEMPIDGHEKLLDALDAHPGPVLLSGYSHPYYDLRLKHWKRDTIPAVAHGGKVAEEVLWINPIAAGQIGQQVMTF